jgi:hypothetical protein
LAQPRRIFWRSSPGGGDALHGGRLLGILTGALLTLILHFAVPFLHAALSFTWVIIAFAVSCVIGSGLRHLPGVEGGESGPD